MNLTVGEVSELPLCAAMVDGVDVLAHTPEWHDPTPGAVTYRARQVSLVVNTDPEPRPECAHAVAALLAEIERTAAALPHRQALRVAMLAASLRVVAGRGVGREGTSADVLEHACAGVASRTALQVSVNDVMRFAVLAPEVAALVLVQLASNAERHDGTASIALTAARGAFTMEWMGSPASSPTTSRRRDDRPRWGLGFARIAADCIGAAVHPPVRAAGGLTTAVLETGLNRLALPLALVRAGAVQKATRAWDEETALLPGAPLPRGGRAAQCVAAAASAPGTIVRVDGWCARTGRQGTWVAVPPDDIVARARDVLDGMVHERALWDGVPEPARSRIVALAAIVAAMLGAELVRVPGATWNRRAPELARAFGLRAPVPVFRGAGAVDPRVALFLACEVGGTFEADGDDLYLHIRPDRRAHPLLHGLVAPGAASLKLS